MRSVDIDSGSDGGLIDVAVIHEAIVVNERYLISWLDHEPKTLSNEDVRRYAAVIEDHSRGWDA